MKKIICIGIALCAISCGGSNALSNSNIDTNPVVDINNLPSDPNKVDSIALTYWDAINLNTPEIEYRLADFYYILDMGSQEREVTVKSFDKLITSLNQNVSIRDSIINLVEEYLYTTASPYLNERRYETFIDGMLQKADLTASERLRYNETLDEIHRNQPGTKIPNITVLTKDGVKSVSEIASDKPMILLIFDNSCYDCVEAIKTLLSHDTLPEMMGQDRIKVLAIDLGEPKGKELDMPGWTWARAKSDLDDQLSFRSLPSAYLIGPDGTILIKDNSVNNILNAIRFK